MFDFELEVYLNIKRNIFIKTHFKLFEQPVSITTYLGDAQY